MTKSEAEELYSLEWAQDLARGTAEALGYDYCVTRWPRGTDQFMAFERVYVEGQLRRGKLAPEDVITAYDSNGNCIDLQEVWECRAWLAEMARLGSRPVDNREVRKL